MKYVIDACYGDVMGSIKSFMYEAEEEQEEWYDDEISCFEVTSSTGLYPEKSVTSSANDYFSFHDVIFKVNKHQQAYGCTVIEELDALDLQWELGEWKNIQGVAEMISSKLKVEYYDNYSDEFHAIQDKYEDYTFYLQ